MLPDLRAGDVVGDKYQVRGLLGQGGMGTVYAVRHALTGKQFALKVLSPTQSDSEAAQRRLIHEALAAGQIEHRYVVDVFDVGEDQGSVYLVMEYLQGKSLARLLKERELSLPEALLLALRTMDGVAAAHARGIIHRDLKPENIYVCHGATGELDEPRVLDFGISMLATDGDLPSSSRPLAGVGTPHYMCVEQLRRQDDIDPRIDVYALGVILYEMLVGRPPFDGHTIGELFHAIESGHAMAVSELRPDVSVEISEVIARAMARDRDDRYETVSDLLDALGEVAEPLLGRPARWRSTPLGSDAPDADTIVDLELQAVFQDTRAVSPDGGEPGWDTSDLPVIEGSQQTRTPKVHLREELFCKAGPTSVPPPNSKGHQRTGYSPWSVALVVLAVLLFGAGVAYLRSGLQSPRGKAQDRPWVEGTN